MIANSISNCMRYLESKESKLEQMLGINNIYRTAKRVPKKKELTKSEIERLTKESIKENGWVSPKELAEKWGCMDYEIRAIYKRVGLVQPNGHARDQSARRRAIAYKIIEENIDHLPHSELSKRVAAACGIQYQSGCNMVRRFKMERGVA